MPRLAIVNTHPIQYYSPLFRTLAARDALNIHVFYGWRGPIEDAHDPGFGRNLSWDIPLLDGYSYTFVANGAEDPGTHHFFGIQSSELISEVEDWDPDAVLVFGWNFHSHLSALRHFQGRVPVLFRGDSTLLDERPGPRKWARRLFLRWVYRYVDVALYVGQNNKEYFEAHGLDERQLTWVPHAVENQRFYDNENTYTERARQWREEIGIPTDAPVVVFAGKLGAKKAPDVLIDAFFEMETAAAHLIIAGDGPLFDVLQERAGNHPAVHFLGFQNQSEMPVVYRLGDVFVLPSRGPGETWGLAINEAMACGRPVVTTTRVGCAPDLVDGSTGKVVPPENVKALSGALDEILCTTSVREAMGENARSQIESWSIEVAAKRTEEAVLQVTRKDDNHISPHAS